MLDLQEGWDQLQRWIRSERIGRRQYVETNVVSGLLGFAVIFTPFLLLLVLPDFNSDFLVLPVTAVGIATAIIMILVYIATSMARLRDIGYSPNWFVAGLIPYVMVIFFIVLAVRRSDSAHTKNPFLRFTRDKVDREKKDSA